MGGVVNASEAGFDPWRRGELKNEYFPHDRPSADAGRFFQLLDLRGMCQLSGLSPTGLLLFLPPLSHPHTPAFLTIFPSKPASLLRPCVWGP